MNKRSKERIHVFFASRTFFFHFGVIAVLIATQFSCLITEFISKPTITETPTITPSPLVTETPTITPTNTPVLIIRERYYVDGSSGNDSNSGSESQPWQSIEKAMGVAVAGDVIIVRGGEYISPSGGWVFQNSGVPSQPITFANYPDEQIVLKIPTTNLNNHNIFRCTINPKNPESWQTPKADHIRIIGTDVSPRLLSNGVESQKGIVMQGLEGEQSSAIVASDCDHWEVAGVDFIEVASGIFTFKNNWHTLEEHSTDYWYVHNNRVYNFYRESGMQFNGNFNFIENNMIYKVSDRLDTPYGCQMLNLLGNNNIVRRNTLGRLGSKAQCLGILFEWDLSDSNLIEENTIQDVSVGISFQGGDNNIIQNNELLASPNTIGAGVQISSYEDQITWPCNDYVGSGGTVEAMIPPDDPSHLDYQYYYNPRNCRSMGNKIINNSFFGFHDAWIMYPLEEDSNIFLGNTISGP